MITQSSQVPLLRTPSRLTSLATTKRVLRMKVVVDTMNTDRLRKSVQITLSIAWGEHCGGRCLFRSASVGESVVQWG